MPTDIETFFHQYADAYTRSLGDIVDLDTIRSSFADCFVAAGAKGEVTCGKNDETFARTLEDAYAFYRKIGTQRMAVRRVESSTIDADHQLARVFYTADYRKASGEAVTIDFDVSYLLQQRGDTFKIFAFVAGDEMALYKKHGLV